MDEGNIIKINKDNSFKRSIFKKHRNFYSSLTKIQTNEIL